MADKQRVGFIGLGTMGKPMARRVLLYGEYPLTVYDVVPAPVDELSNAGATAAASPRAVAEASDVVITMLPNSPHVEAAILGENGVLEGLRPSTIVIDMSTIDPAVTRKVAARVAEKGARMLDAPVGKSSPAAVDGTLTIMVGGDEATFEECRPILSTMGTTIVHCGETGAGEAMKLTHNLMGCLIVAAVSEGLALGARAGLKPDLMLDVIGHSGPSSFHLVNTFPKQVLSGNLEPGFMMDLMYKDLGLISAMGSDLGVPLPLANLTREVVSMARREGLGKLDWTALLTLYEKWAGVQVRLDKAE